MRRAPPTRKRLVDFERCLQNVPTSWQDTTLYCEWQASLKASHLGAELCLAKVRSSPVLEVIWYMRMLKSGSNFELAPVRPAVCLRAALGMDADSLKRLF